MTLREWAAGYAEELLAPLGDRWAHVQASSAKPSGSLPSFRPKMRAGI